MAANTAAWSILPIAIVYRQAATAAACECATRACAYGKIKPAWHLTHGTTFICAWTIDIREMIVSQTAETVAILSTRACAERKSVRRISRTYFLVNSYTCRLIVCVAYYYTEPTREHNLINFNY